MKLLFDQNLSARLVVRLEDLFPQSIHVKTLGMTQSDDSSIWNYARDQGFTLVSKDSDFQQRSLVLGAPPKVVWLRIGNCRTSQIEDLIRIHAVELHTFEREASSSLLILSPAANT